MTLSPAEFFSRATTERTAVGPVRYAWRKFGEGPALLLIHGFPLSGFTWRKVLPQLAEHYTCYVPDLPGLGDTEWAEDTDFSWHGHTRGLMGLVDALGLRHYRVMGHDTGGTFARCLGLLDGARIEKIAIINSELPGHRPPWIPLYQKLMFAPGAPAMFAALLRSQLFLRSPMAFGGCFNDLSLIEGDFREHFVAPIVRDPRRMRGVQLYLRSLKWDVVDRLGHDHARLAMPVRLIWGADDPTFPLVDAYRMVRQLPHGSLVGIPGAKLMAHEEKPADVARAVLQFFS
ncbi:MAG: alpha/beta fold hydrolase [Nevskiaceae bacterium]